MKIFKNIAGCIGVTISLWLVSRFIPAFLSSLDPDSAPLKIFAFSIMLPLGWWVVKIASRDRHSKCIRANLYIFALIEVPGIFNAITYLLQEMTFNTGRYSIDANGIAYSDYFAIFGSLLLFEVLYIFLCFYLAKKTISLESSTEQNSKGLSNQKNLDPLYYALLGIIAALVIAIIMVAIVLF